MNKLLLLWKKFWAFVLGEEVMIELNVEELKAGLQRMREAATKSLALAKQAQNEALALQKERDALHQAAVTLQKNGSEEAALAKLDAEDAVQLKLDAALARFQQLQDDAADNWERYQQKAKEVENRIEQAKHLQKQAEVTRLRAEAQKALDPTALNSAMAEFDDRAKEIELQKIEVDTQAAVEKALSGQDKLLAEGDRILKESRMQERLAALKQEALGEGQTETTDQRQAEEVLKGPVLAKVQKTL